MRLGASPRSSIAPALVLPYPVLVTAGLHLRPGQVSLTISAPGVGKSQLWQNLAYRMRVPTLFWSADTDESDVTARSLSLVTGWPVDDIEERLVDEAWREWMLAKLRDETTHIEWVFDSAIEGRTLAERVTAFAEVRGDYPTLVVVDNVSNAITSIAEEYAQTKEFLARMQELARRTHAHVACLSHAKGEFDSGTKPIPQSGGLQNPFKTPEVGITMYRPDEDNRLAVNVVKNRGGRSDPAARHAVTLPIDFTRAAVLGHTPELVAA